MTIETKLDSAIAQFEVQAAQIADLRDAMAAVKSAPAEAPAVDPAAELKAKFYAEIQNGSNQTLVKDGSVKSFNTADQASAGAGIVTEVSKAIVQRMRDEYVVAGLFGLETANSVDYEKRVQVGASTTQWMGENVNCDGAPVTATPTFDTIRMTHGKLAAFPVLTAESLTDTFFNAEAFVLQDISREMSRGIALGVLNGTGGAHQPKGFYKHFNAVEGAKAVEDRKVDAFPVATAAIGTDAELLEALRALPFKLPARYVVGGKYVVSREMFERVSALKDSIGRHYLYTSETQGVAGKLFGYDVVIDPMNVSVEFPVVFGHLDEAFKLVNIPSSLTLLKNMYAIPGCVRFECFQRVGTIVNDNQAVVALTAKAVKAK